MHFHHRHDISGCTDTHSDWPDWAVTVLATLDRQGYQIMAVTQQSADHAADVISELVARVADLEKAVAEPAPVIDSSKLDEALAAADAALAPAAPVDAPAAPAPVDAPAADPAPAADAPAADAPVADPVTAELPAVAADGTVPAQGIPSVPLA